MIPEPAFVYVPGGRFQSSTVYECTDREAAHWLARDIRRQGLTAQVIPADRGEILKRIGVQVK